MLYVSHFFSGSLTKSRVSVAGVVQEVWGCLPGLVVVGEELPVLPAATACCFCCSSACTRWCWQEPGFCYRQLRAGAVVVNLMACYREYKLLFLISACNFHFVSLEHVCSILASLLRNLRGQQRTRLLNKFTENDSEKVSVRNVCLQSLGCWTQRTLDDGRAPACIY